ncbi:MAG: LamG-like jellyroll fold domain-containing protein, partial [Pseudomonadota bacterium]
MLYSNLSSAARNVATGVTAALLVLFAASAAQTNERVSETGTLSGISEPVLKSSSPTDLPGLIVVSSNSESELNAAIDTAQSGSQCAQGCVIDIRATGSFSLAETLNKISNIDHPIWLVGKTDGNTEINGNANAQHLFVDNAGDGFFALQRVTLINGKVQGGEGKGGAGGGLGAGGAMFINNGLVVLDRVTVQNSHADKGVSSGHAGDGNSVATYNGESRPGYSGGKGGRLNDGQRYAPGDAISGSAGAGGDCVSTSRRVCGPQDKQHGGQGGFGSGGGGAGGGSGGYASGNWKDAAGEGGNGGNGGFGGGAGGGGGGGGDKDGSLKGEPADGGSGGSGGTYVSVGGTSGTGGSKWGGAGAGGTGSDGVGFGGGIFVRGVAGGQLIANNAQFSGNSASTQGDALFVSKSDDAESSEQKGNDITDYGNNGYPTLSLSVVDLDGKPNNRFIEGERANLVINVSGSLPSGADVPVYLYLSDLNALAEPGTGDITKDQSKDFAWNGSNLMKLMLPAGQSDNYYVSLPNAGATNALGAYSGIQTYLDKQLEGNESFTISLLSGPGYQLADQNTSQTIVIEDANYQVELLSDTASNRYAICDVADALEAAVADPASDCVTGDRATKIDVDALKGLGYVTVQAKRPVGFFRDAKDSGLPGDWATNTDKHSTQITGELFNNALAAGLPVHYSIVDKPADVLSNQLNYNNTKYADIAGELLHLEGAQVFNAVVIPVTDADTKQQQSLPPGAARIYFSALPDAIQEAAQTFTLSLTSFPNDPSYDPENLCNDDNQAYCAVLNNAPDGVYQFYTVTSDANDNTADLTVYDSGEFKPEIVLIDNINGEIVTDAQNSANPLLTDAQGGLAFWVKLGSQPAAAVTVTIAGKAYSFGPDNWYLYQSVALAAADWSDTVSVIASSTDPNYGNNRNKTLTPNKEASRLKIKEADIPFIQDRIITVGIQATVADYEEGGLNDPAFNIVLSQPLPIAVTAQVTATFNGASDTYQTAIPAWQQTAQMMVPVPDNNVVDGQRVLSATIDSVQTTAGTPLDNIVVAGEMNEAVIAVQDDEKATILISQHLPDAPSKGDIAHLLPDIEILGIGANGNLHVQQTDSRLKEIVLSPVGAVNSVDATVTQQGLLYELIDKTPTASGADTEAASDEAAGADYTPIVLPSQPYKARINTETDPFSLSDIPANQIVRQRGYITVNANGLYTFSFNAPAGQAVELWLNAVDDFSQNKSLIAPRSEDTGLVNASAPIELKTDTRYYIEALYVAPESGAGGAVAVQYQYQATSEDDQSTATTIPLAWLSPATIDGGFSVEIFEGIGTESLETFMQSDRLQNGMPDRTEILTSTLEIPAVDAVTDVGRRIVLTLIAPENGEYQFAIASDGDSALYLQNAEGEQQKIAWVDGDEKYGNYVITTKTDNYGADQITRTEFDITRFGDSINENTSWTINYTMANDTQGTLPFGANGKASIFPTINVSEDAHICDDNPPLSSEEFSNVIPKAPVANQNTFTFSGPGNCDDPFFTDYDGKSVTLIFQDLAGAYTSDQYTKLVVDGCDLDAPADYPAIQDWYWSETPYDDRTCTSVRQSSMQRSQPITLAQGQEYTFEIVQINARDDDHLSVAWQRPSSTSLEVIDAQYTALTRLTLPVTLVEASGSEPTSGAKSVTLRLDAAPITYKGNDYEVTAITLAGDPQQTNATGATPNQAPGWLAFGSGFAATVNQDTQIRADQPSEVQITLQDRASNPQTVNLSVGQQQRLGLQLKGQPATNIDVEVTVSYPAVGGGETNTAEVALTCQAGIGSACMQFTFTAQNWDQPQYVTVEAVAEGPVANEDYQPSLSIATITAAQVGKSTNNDFIQDAVTVNILPDSTQNTTVYFAKARGTAITTIGFADTPPEPSTIPVNSATSGALSWFWRIEDNQLKGATTEGGSPIIVLSAMSDAEAASMAGSGIPVDADPVTLTASVELTEEYYTNVNDMADTLTISRLPWLINDATVGALATVVINNGQPSITLDSMVNGTTTYSTTDLEYFAYTPTDTRRDAILAQPDEVLVTESGELSLVGNDADMITWQYEPNPRVQPENLAFKLHLASTGDQSETIDLTQYQSAPSLATSLSALTDYTKPQVTLTGFTADTESNQSIDLTVSLKTPDGSAAYPATADVNVYYSLAQLGTTDPGNMALDLTAKPDSESAVLQSARSLVLAEPLVLQQNSGETFTLEAWIQPQDLQANQGVLAGQDGAGSNVDLMQLSGGSIEVLGGLTVELPASLIPESGFQVAWQVSEEGQALFINGEKVAQNTTPLADQAPLTLTEIGQSSTGYLTGLIDEVRVWDIARSDLLINQNYLTALVASDDADTAGLLGYWSFNDFDLTNPLDATTQAQLENASGELLDTTLQMVQQTVWRVQQSATLGADYTGLSHQSTPQRNLFGLTAQESGGRSTFAIADLNQDDISDAVVVDQTGAVSVHLSTAKTRQTQQYRQIKTKLNLGHAAPLTLGDIDGDKDLDLIAGLANGQLAVMRNLTRRGAVKTRRRSVRFGQMKTLALNHSRLRAGELKDTVVIPVLHQGKLWIAAKDKLLNFDLRAKRGKLRLQEANTALPLHNLALNTRLQSRHIVPQFVDLDRDGDHDLVLDTLRNLPGQLPGSLTYLENYGTDAKPAYFPAPRSHIARILKRIPDYLAPAQRRRDIQRHAFDQVEYHQIVDFNRDGYDDMVVSDNYGQIHLFASEGYDFVTIPQGQSSATISLNLIDDAQVEPTEAIIVQLVEGKPAAADYHFVTGQDRAVVEIEDNDQAGVLITDANGAVINATPVNISEVGGASAYQIQLTSQPTSDVTLRLASSDSSNGGLVALGTNLNEPPVDSAFTDNVILKFTAQADDWSTPKVFWVKGVDDRIDDPDTSFVIAAVSNSSDAAYAKQVAVLKAISTDNDDQAIVNFDYASLPLIDGTGAVISSEGQVNAVTVSLNAQPTEPVTLTLQPTDGELTLYPQRKLVRALKTNAETQSIRRTYSRGADIATCTLPSGHDGVRALGDYGIWCWAEDGEYQYQQARFGQAAGQVEQMAFMVDNSYGSLSTDTLSAALNPLPTETVTPRIMVYDLLAKAVIGDDAAPELLRRVPHNSKSNAVAMNPMVSFAVRPSTQPNPGETISIQVSGLNTSFKFTADNWQQWQRVDVQESALGATVTISATTGDLAASYSTDRVLTTVATPTAQLMVRDWRTAQQVADNTDGAQVYAAKDGQLILQVRLSSPPDGEVTVAVTEDAAASLTFNADNYAHWRMLSVQAGTATAVNLTAKTASADYSKPRQLAVVKQPLASAQGNYFDYAGNLAGESLALTFTPQNWQLAQTIAVSAVDDQKVEYNQISTIDVLLANPAQVLTGNYGQVRWDTDGTISISLQPDLAAGFYAEKRLWLTNDDGVYDNQTLDLTIRITEVAGEETTYTTEVLGYLNAPDCARAEAACPTPPAAITFKSTLPGIYAATLDVGETQLTGVAQQPLAAAFLAREVAPIAVSIEDNDRPVVRAGVDLDAGENTHPGYFTLSVSDPIGIPGGLGVHYSLYGFNSSPNHGATAETEPPASGALQDPGPDFQGYDQLRTGTLFIPEGKTRVSLPIFPIDDFTPEESLAARYEKVVLMIEPPVGDSGYAGDQYILDTQNPEYQTAGVRILDNEDVGLKYVIPIQGLTVDEGSFNAFKVGLTSQPQTEVTLDFYNSRVIQKNRSDGSYLQASSVKFDNTNWNQWKIIDVQLYDNQTQNHDAKSPRFSDLYFTLLDKSDGSDGLNCNAHPTDPTQCEPFYNMMKGALNLTAPDKTTDKEAKAVEVSAISIESNTSAAGNYGTLSLTPIKGTDSEQYAGDFVYVLNNGQYGTADKRADMLAAIAASPNGELQDVFDYQMTSTEGEVIDQKVAVQIQALERTQLQDVSADDQTNLSFPAGQFGTLTFSLDDTSNRYTYTFDSAQIETALNTTEAWQINDAFVFQLQSGVPNGDMQTENIAFNIVVTKSTRDNNGTQETYYQALINGNAPDTCTAESIDTVCLGSDTTYQISGDVIPQTIGGSVAGATVEYKVLKIGQPHIEPVVTRISLRDSNNEALWADNTLITTNPLFDANHINGTQQLVEAGTTVAGDYGSLTVNADGTFNYVVDTTSLYQGLQPTDIRQVADEFVVQLNDHSRMPLSLVSTLQVNQSAEKLVVTLNDELLEKQTTSTYTGQLMPTDPSQAESLTVVRAGPLPHTIRLREQSLPQQVLAEGLAAALNYLQARFYDASVPVFGRMGGGPTTDTTGNKDEAKAPSFTDRFMTLLTSGITAQPHLTTEDFALLVNTVLQATFAQYNVPIQVLKIDSEKVLLKFTYTYGVSAATNEYKTDWGMPGMGHFSGSAAGTFKLTADLIFGINYCTVVSGDAGQRMGPSAFIVTDQTTLNTLMGAPDEELVNIYTLKTWDGVSIGQTGVQFLDRHGKQMQISNAALQADNTDAINQALKEKYNDVTNISPQIHWKWLEENNSMSWNLNDTYGNAKGGVPDFGTLIGYVTNNTGEEFGDFIAISLRQPTAIGPNTTADIQLGVVLDPDGILQSNRSANKLKKDYIGAVLGYLNDTNTQLAFSNQKIKVFDIYSDQKSANNKAKNLHESQALSLDFDVEIKQQGATDPIGVHLDSWVAEPILTKKTPDVEIASNQIVLPVDGTYVENDPKKYVVTHCTSSGNGSKCETKKLKVKAQWKQNGSVTERLFPTNKNAFKTKTTYSETVTLAQGKLKLKGKVQNASGGKKEVKWTWEFSSLPAKLQYFPTDSNVIAVEPITLTSTSDANDHETIDYMISRHMLMFLEGQPSAVEGQAVSKITADLSGSIEFRGDAQLFVVGGSINQAAAVPTNVEATSLIQPDAVYSKLIGNPNAKSTIVNIEDSNANADTPAFIVGQYGVLALAKDGSYGYYRKPELDYDNWTLNCADYTEVPTSPNDASLKVFCKDLLALDENGNSVHWDDLTQPQVTLAFKGYTVEGCDTYAKVATGESTCTVKNPNVIYVPQDAKTLTQDGVSSLETTINTDLVNMSNWQDTANLNNRKPLKAVYQIVNTGEDDNILYGMMKMVDEFFISTRTDTAFRKLKVALSSVDTGISVEFNDVPYNGLSVNSYDYAANPDLPANGWTGGSLNYHEPGIGEPLQVSSLSINPMAEANVFIDVALRDPKKEPTGMLYISDLKNPKNIVQYALGGNAALYARFNAGIGAPPKQDDDDPNYQAFSLPGPSVATNIGLVAQYEKQGNFADISSSGGEFMFGAFNLELDLGEFISEKLVDPLGSLNNWLEPIRPVANALTADMKIFSAINLEHVFDANHDGKVTVLEIPTPFLQKRGSTKDRYEKQLQTVNRFLEFIASIAQMIKIADELGTELSGAQALDERVLSVDGYQLSPDLIRIVPYQTTTDLTGVDVSLVPYVNSLGHAVLGIDTNYQYIKTFGGTLTSSSVRPMEPVKPVLGKPAAQQNTSMSKVKSRYADLRKDGVISFPILSNPMDVLKFIFGDPADLVLIDVPDFAFNFEIEKGWRPPPVPIFKGKISGSMDMLTDTIVGIDTGGLLQTICGDDSPGAIWNCQGNLAAGDRAIRLLNSVYLRDWNEQSYYVGGDTSSNKTFWQGNERQLPGITVWDKYELAGNAQIDIGAGLDLGVFGAFFQGGPGLGGGIDLVDICESTTPDACDPIVNGDFTAGGSYDGKIRAYDFVMQMVNDPMSAFDMGFTFYVDFEAYIETFKIKVWEELIGYFPLFEFDASGAHWVGGSRSVSGAALAGATLYFDANNNQQLDPGEPMTFTDAKGLGRLRLPYNLYDRNRDGRIDRQDGTIRHFGGMNVRTGLGEL